MQGAHAVGALAHGVGVLRQVVLDERGRSKDACLLTLALTERIAPSLSRAKSLLIFDFDFGRGLLSIHGGKREPLKKGHEGIHNKWGVGELTYVGLR